MSHASRAAHIQDLIYEFVALHLAQAANLREFAQAMETGEQFYRIQPELQTGCERSRRVQWAGN